jgi:hypothetical protein
MPSMRATDLSMMRKRAAFPVMGGRRPSASVHLATTHGRVRLVFNSIHSDLVLV